MAEPASTPTPTKNRLTVVFVPAEEDKMAVLVYPVPRATFIGRFITNEPLLDPIPQEQIPEDLTKLVKEANGGFVSITLQRVAVAGYDILQAAKTEKGIFFH